MSRLTRNGTAEPVSRDQSLRRERGQGNICFPCSAAHESDWQHYPVDPYPAIGDVHTKIQSAWAPDGHVLQVESVIKINHPVVFIIWL